VAVTTILPLIYFGPLPESEVAGRIPPKPKRKAGEMSLEEIDREAEEVRVGFRITLADLQGRVESVEYIERETLNIAVIRLDNGFWLVGKAAPVDTNNYNAEYGRKLAYEDALRQAWSLLAFAHLEVSS
jgi:hypothetical protein